MQVTRSKLGWIPKTRLVDSNAESSVHARAAASIERPRAGPRTKSADSLGGPTGDVRYTESAAQPTRHFEARRGEAEEEGTRDRRHG
jgi:hypothetical protein